MRLFGSVALAMMIGANPFFLSGLAQAECDRTKLVEPVSRFAINGETVYDNKTDLTWMRCSYGQAWSEGSGCSGDVTELAWDAAMALKVQGDGTWRVPQKEELESIVATNCKKPAINEEVFPGTPWMRYWTSTASGPSHAWVVFFRTGMSTWTFPRSTLNAVRLVRTGR
jgi:hypothetical protein